MKINIKSLTITNFKGIKSLEVPFKHITDIFGENAAGKTTVFDAFTWLFFGKDSTDRKDFELKPLDANGNALQKVDVEVSAIIDVEGKEINIRRVQREKWVKKRGDLNTEFAGNETLYYWNDVPLQQKQFADKINDIAPEALMKLLTNPLYYNSLKWQERRSILMNLVPSITNEELVAINPDFKSLIKILEDKTLEEYKREVAAKKRKIKDDLQAIPTRIDEINKNMPEAIDFNALRKEVTTKTDELNTIDESLQDAVKQLQSAQQGLREKQTSLHELKSKALNIKAEVRNSFADAHQERKNKIADLQRELSNLTSQLDNKSLTIKHLTDTIVQLEKEKATVASDWEKTNAEQLVFTEDQFNCPACKRPLEADHIHNSKEILTNNFNTGKASRLNYLLEKGTGLKNKIAAEKDKLQGLSYEHAELNNIVLEKQSEISKAIDEHNTITANAENEFNTLLAENKDYINVNAQIKVLEEELQAPANEIDNSELKQKKAAINIELDALKKQLADEDRIAQSKTRIEQLQSEEGKLAQQLADLEGTEYLAEQFTKAKMDTLVQRINGRFKLVTFKLFDTQINGGEVECCDTMINGVPFPDANNAAKINAGLDIINTLCDHYGIYAPIFIDNRESVNELIECNSQIVNLIVSKDKKLRVA